MTDDSSELVTSSEASKRSFVMRAGRPPKLVTHPTGRSSWIGMRI